MLVVERGVRKEQGRLARSQLGISRNNIGGESKIKSQQVHDNDSNDRMILIMFAHS